jgi:DNA transposition AAA+ family ATPase
MDSKEKYEIAKEVKWQAEKTSQNIVAGKAQVSAATISQIVSGNWSHIADRMFRKVQRNLRIDLNWKTALTDNLNEVYYYCEKAQKESISLCISDHAGRGKTNGYRFYDRRNKEVLHLECETSWTKKTFVRAMLLAIGSTYEGTTEQMLQALDRKLRDLENPLLILDQADKLKDPQLDLFMDMYNAHKGYLGIILSGVKALEKRIEKGRRRDKIGYAEIHSRFGGNYISLDPIRLKDVKLICEANGVDDEEQVQTIYDTCRGDLRRVERGIKAVQIAKQKTEKISA